MRAETEWRRANTWLDLRLVHARMLPVTMITVRVGNQGRRRAQVGKACKTEQTGRRRRRMGVTGKCLSTNRWGISIVSDFRKHRAAFGASRTPPSLSGKCPPPLVFHPEILRSRAERIHR